ncbi:MAG: NDP-sugar pyrophosphorylase family protein [Gammaproteobacteria bacterium]|jgi:NDP-sugar pyrophosphorylase family protein
MQAVIFADRHGAELAPLCQAQCPALLSVANRPLLQYTIEDLATAGVTDILLVVSDNAARIEALFGDGAMWGVRIRYLLSRGEESPQRVLTRFATLLQTPFLAARGDVLRSAACTELLSAAESRTGPVIGARLGTAQIGLCLVREWPAALPGLAWPLGHTDPHTEACAPLKHALFAPLDSLACFHKSALQMAGSGDKHLPAPGVEHAPGLRAGRLSQIHPQNQTSGGHIAIGEQAWVHGTARLMGLCVIGSDCYIDRGVQIHNTVVMPGTYIGENLQIENAIIDGNRLIRIDLGIEIEIDEPKLLSDNGGDIAEWLQHWCERSIGATVLILSLPLWPLGLFAAILASPHTPIKRRPIQINRSRHRHRASETQPSVVKAWQFATRIPVLSKLPMLWLVARGDLRLFGARPPCAGALRRPGISDKRHVLHDAFGLLGPAALYLPLDAPEEEIHLCELEFVADARFSTRLLRLLGAARALFNRRAWWLTEKSLGGA